MIGDITGLRRQVLPQLQLALRALVGKILKKDTGLGHHLAVIEAKRRHITLRIDGKIVLALFSLPAAKIDLDQIERQPRSHHDRIGTLRRVL